MAVTRDPDKIGASGIEILSDRVGIFDLGISG